MAVLVDFIGGVFLYCIYDSDSTAEAEAPTVKNKNKILLFSK